jgi:hypothetical protein
MLSVSSEILVIDCDASVAASGISEANNVAARSSDEMNTHGDSLLQCSNFVPKPYSAGKGVESQEDFY